MQKRNAVIIVVLVITLVWTSLAGAQENSVRDLAQIIESRKLVVAMVDRDYPPYILQGQDGQLAGRSVDMAKDIAKELGVTLEIVKTASFDGVVEKVASGQADIGFPLSVTISRAMKVKFTNPYQKHGILLLLNRMKMAAADLEAGMQHLDELKNTTAPIGVIGRSAHAEAADRHFPKAKVQKYSRIHDMVRAVEKGEILLAIGNTAMLNGYLEENPHLLVKLQPFLIKGRFDHIAIAVGVEVDHLLSWLNVYLAKKGPTAR
jgi:polar amino acid transport system substrate-binding protein